MPDERVKLPGFDGLYVGVTGHMNLKRSGSLDRAIFSAIEMVRTSGNVSSGDRPIAILTGLAGGADQFVTAIAMPLPDVHLLVILPFGESAYLAEFPDDDTRSEYRRLIADADSVTVLEYEAYEPDSYSALGQCVVDNCDVMIALWNGQPPNGPGGTGDVVEAARAAGKPLIWIHTGDGDTIHVERWDAPDAAP